jgi:hypothetical protein
MLAVVACLVFAGEHRVPAPRLSSAGAAAPPMAASFCALYQSVIVADEA